MFKLDHKIKDIFLPRLSEIDAFVLSLSLVIYLISDWVRVVGFLAAFDFRTLIFLLLFVYWFFLILKNLLTRKAMNGNEKSTIARAYFLLLGSLSVVSAFDYLLKPMYGFFEEMQMFDILNFAIVFFILLRSLTSLGILKALQRQPEELTSQVKDEQAGFSQIILAAVSIYVIHGWLIGRVTNANAILLGFFYTTTVVHIFEAVAAMRIKGN